MTDPLRSGPNSASEAPDRERDARVEELLLVGLDHYFSGRHDLAINIWTRVLFLDRGHARARAYIERARSAIAERQREGEELLHTGVAAFQRGDQETARTLLKSAVERGAGGEEAMVLLDRLARLDANTVGGAVARPAPRPVRDPGAQSADAGHPRLFWTVAGVGAGVILAGLALIGVGDRRAALLGLSRPAPVPQQVRAEEPLPVPTASELSVRRARALRARGHLREALVALESIGYGDRFRQEADELRGVIQTELLAAARGTEGAGAVVNTPVRE